MNPLSLQTNAGIERFRKDQTLGEGAIRQPVENATEQLDTLSKRIDTELPAFDGGQYDSAPAKGVLLIRQGNREDVAVYAGDSKQGASTEQSRIPGAQGYAHTEFSAEAVDRLAVDPNSATLTHLDRTDPKQSYSETLDHPWNVFDRPSQAPTAPTVLGDTPLTTTPSGLQYAVLSPGSGSVAQPGHPVLVDYTGWLKDGTSFDSSLKRGDPFDFTLGAGAVIKGWDEGVAGMKVGETRRLEIPPELGYGARPVGPIPANSTLTFEVKLLATE